MIDAEGAAQTLTSKATRSGLLRKQADNEPGAWNEYYFVLKPLTYLFYYNSKDDETPRGIIDLEYLTDIKRNADCLQRAVGGGDNCFRVSGKLPKNHSEPNANGDKPKMRPLYLDTDDEEEAEKWMDAIRNHRFSLKKDEQFFEMVHNLHDAEYQLSQLQEVQRKEADAKRALRVKAHVLLQKMRLLEAGKHTDSLQDEDFDADDESFDMLSTLEAMEDVMVDMEAKMKQQRQEIAKLKEANAEKDQKLIAETMSSRRNRGFTQVLQRAVSRYDNVSESEEEESPPASRRAPKPRDEPPVSRDKSVSDVQSVVAMWNAKKKKSPTQPAVPEDDSPDETESRNNRNRIAPRSGRSMTTAAETGSTPQTNASVRKFVAALQKRAAKADRESEEDTVSIDSTDERRSGEETEENIPAGWTKHESRGYPGTYYYAHETGVTSWDVPTENTLRELGGEPAEEEPVEEDRTSGNRVPERNSGNNRAQDRNSGNTRAGSRERRPTRVGTESSRGAGSRPVSARAARQSRRTENNSYLSSGDDLSEFESDEDAGGGATSSAAYRVKKPAKPKSGWTFKLPKLLPTATNAPTEAASSTSPIAHGANHHEF